MTKTEQLYIELIEILRAKQEIPRHLQRLLLTQWGKEIKSVIEEDRLLNEKFLGKSEAIELALG